MSSRLWHEVDSYITDTLVQPDAALAAALEASDAAGLPQINVSPAHGKLLWLLARLQNARRILEVGTLAFRQFGRHAWCQHGFEFVDALAGNGIDPPRLHVAG